jgi:hypothetical protein
MALLDPDNRNQYPFRQIAVWYPLSWSIKNELRVRYTLTAIPVHVKSDIGSMKTKANLNTKNLRSSEPSQFILPLK